MLYQSVQLDEDVIKLINGINKHRLVPIPIMSIILKYWRQGAKAKLLLLNRKFYSYSTRWFRHISEIELSRITVKCRIRNFNYKVCVQIDNVFISIYPSIGQYQIGKECKQMICNEIGDEIWNHPVKKCNIVMKLKFFKAFVCEIGEHEHEHENSSVEITLFEDDIYDLPVSSGRFFVDLNDDIFKKNKFVYVFSWDGKIDANYEIFADKCEQSWNYDGMWNFRFN